MNTRFFTFIFIALLAICCTTPDHSASGGSNDSFDRGAMLTNLADHIIIPSLEDLNNKLSDLVTSKNTFIETPNEGHLAELRGHWLEAYKTWQYVEVFNIGKAEEIQYNFQMNIYPTTVLDIENNLSSGTYDLKAPNNHDAVGFPAVDYLLHGIATSDALLVEKYTAPESGLQYASYLSDVIDQMKTLTQDVLTSWTGGYRDRFIASTENTASSAVNKLVNDFIFYFEKGLRAYKIGIPAGVFSTTPLPEKVEAFYSQENSKLLSTQALTAVQNVFNGKHYNSATSGPSFSSYLTSLQKTGLSTLINDQLNSVSTNIEDLDTNFHKQIETDNSKMTAAYDMLQIAVVLLKVDMLQAFNISVDYVDADGD